MSADISDNPVRFARPALPAKPGEPVAVYGRYQVVARDDIDQIGVWYVKRPAPIPDGSPITPATASGAVVEAIVTSERQARRVAAAMHMLDIIHWLLPVMLAGSTWLPLEAMEKLRETADLVRQAWRP